MNTIVSGNSSTRTHPTLEEIAALVDQTTTADERRRLVAHVSSCEFCYELFAETARLVHGDRDDAVQDAAPESASVAAQSNVRRGPWRRSLTWAGGLLAAASVALLFFTPAADIFRARTVVLPVADLASPLIDRTDAGVVVAGRWQDRGWPITLGETVEFAPEDRRSFRLGVRVLELDVALRTGSRDTAEELTFRIESLVEADELSGALSAYYAGGDGIRDGLRAGMPTAQLLELAREADELLGPEQETGDTGFADPFWYAFGKWAAAGELAAMTGNDRFFDQPSHRSFLRRLRKAPLPADLQPEVEAVVQELDRGDQQASKRLQELYAELITVAGGGQPPEANAPSTR